MAKSSSWMQFSNDKKEVIFCLKSIQATLIESVNEGMIDEDDDFYNEINSLLDEADLVKTYPELAEVVTKAKILETDIDTWLSLKRRESLSLSWPKIPKS